MKLIGNLWGDGAGFPAGLFGGRDVGERAPTNLLIFHDFGIGN